jgi:hypothetical protein
MKYEFKECIRRLKSELDAVAEIKKSPVEAILPKRTESEIQSKQENETEDSAQKTPKVARAPQTVKNIKVEHLKGKEFNLSEKDVEYWLKEKRIHPSIVASLIPCTSQILQELLILRLETPDFFYKMLSQSGSYLYFLDSPISLKDVAIFSYELKKLFLDKFTTLA